jgi:hypothetical protein
LPVSDQQPPGWTPPQEPPPEQPPSWQPPPPPPPPTEQPPAWGAPPPPPQQPPTQQWAPPPGAGGYQQYGYPGYAPPRKTEGNAIAALVLAICSFIICPLIPAIIALFLASNANRNIQASGGALEGDGMVKAAKIIAWINIGLCLLGVAIIIIAVIGAAVSSDSDSFNSLGALTRSFA